jgi:hypothetical protein
MLKLLEISLPSPVQVSILRAALLSRAEESDSWDAAIDNPRAGVNRLLPLLSRAARLHQFPVSAGLRTHLAAASIREEARARVVSQLCFRALERLSHHKIPVIVLRGVAAAETVYPSPDLRHCHDLDLFVSEDLLPAAVCALRGLFDDRGGSAGSVLFHLSGFPLSLHTSLFPVAPFCAAIPRPFEWTMNAPIAGLEAKLLAPEANLLHTLAHAATFGSWKSPCWVADAWFLMNRHTIDWTWIDERAAAGQMAGPMRVMLSFLKSRFDAAVPSDLLESLRVATQHQSPTARLAAEACVLASARGRPGELFRIAPGGMARVNVMRRLVLPPPQYLSWMEGPAAHWRLPLRYVSRSVRFLVGGLRARA